MRTLTCDPKAEVIGQTMLSFIDNAQSDDIQPYLVKHGLTVIQPEEWYPLQRYLDLLNDMATGTNLSDRLVAIGMAVTRTLIVPPELENASLGDMLMGWDALYQFQHRNADIGYVKTEKLSDTHYKSVHKHVYPDNLTYGVAYGLAKRWLPQGTHFKVYYDEAFPSLDRGGSITTIHVEW